jgi:predicted membrane protein
MFLFSSPVLGAALLAIGAFFFLKYFFKFDSVFYKPFFTILLILIGMNFLLSDFKYGNSPDSNTLFIKDGVLNVNDPKSEYNVMFTKGTTNFTNLPVGGGNHLVDTNTVFAKNIILIRKDIPVRILVYPTLGLIQLPNGLKIIPFFKNIYTTKPFTDESKAINIKINMVFGVVEVREE